MASSFGWLDTDSAQQGTMLEVLDQFSDAGIVDEIGIGTIRDAIADLLFPGTSTLHTRLRYVLFIPWLMHEASAGNRSPAEMASAFRELEIRLIAGLERGGEVDGVIGREARRNLKRTPSDVYWAALRTWGVRVDDASRLDYFRKRHDLRALQRRTEQSDDPGARETFRIGVFDDMLPTPPTPTDAHGRWHASVTFDLTSDEEDYLAQRLIETVPDSLLAWLVRNPPIELPDAPWQLDLSSAPAPLRERVTHAQRFQAIVHGASLLYNLLLARASERDELVDHYAAALDEWRGGDELAWALETWQEQEFWDMILRQNPRIRHQTRVFFAGWVRLAADSPDIGNDADAARHITSREHAIKGSRARLVNQAALDAWGGSSAADPLQFRWPFAKSHLADLAAARASREQAA